MDPVDVFALFLGNPFHAEAVGGVGKHDGAKIAGKEVAKPCFAFMSRGAIQEVGTEGHGDPRRGTLTLSSSPKYSQIKLFFKI